MTFDYKIEELWRIANLVRRRRTHKDGYIREMLSWRGYLLIWEGGERLRFVSEVRGGRNAKWIIFAGVAVVVVALLLAR